jgi:glycosyltransferase involved in cell wall biosynthesis
MSNVNRYDMPCMEMTVMSSVSASKKVTGKEYSVDLLLFGDSSKGVNWQHGECARLRNTAEIMRIQEINVWAQTSRADYLLLWGKPQNLPEPEVLSSIMESGIDLAHCGLKQGLGTSLQDLCILGFSWDKLNASPEIISTSWRLGLDACLVRRELFLSMGRLDPVFQSQAGAGLEFGYRCLKLGAVTEHRPELYTGNQFPILYEPPVHDLYCFLLRHYQFKWARYMFFRRMLRITNWVNEWKSWQSARYSCVVTPAQWTLESSVTKSPVVQTISSCKSTQVSVVIPTLDRYQYIPQALNSLLEQTVLPAEVIVVDQNRPENRQPDIYQGYERLNLRVIWQNERGQSLARNTGLSAANTEYVFLFDDDSIAYPDLIERHLGPVLSGRYHVSTGVALPHPPIDNFLPPQFRFPRLSQTFDTGNSLMRLDLIRQMGGLDRNYDFGPGADADLGTRLYLAGYRILLNPAAIRIHFKAPGGLRVHGADKYNTDAGLLKPFPPITLSYYHLRYTSRHQYRESVLLSFVLSKFPLHLRKLDHPIWWKYPALVKFIFSFLFLPLKEWRSRVKAYTMIHQGARLGEFS